MAVAVAWAILSRGGFDPMGKPLGTDFVSFWTASRLALGGNPAKVYDAAAHYGLEQAWFGRGVGYSAFFYPPVFLLICLPLGTLSYMAALGAWLGATGLAYYRIVRAWLGERFGVTPVLAFPAVFINIGHGQNGLLSTALFGCGALILNRRPIVAGICFGCLIYKPHLGLVVPFVLLAGGRWRTILGAAGAVAVLASASFLLFGADTWRGFFAGSALARYALEHDLVGDAKMQSTFAAVRLLHGGLLTAYAAQFAVASFACVWLVVLQRRAFRSDAVGAAIIASALLTSPFLLDYDLALLAIPMAWLAREGVRTGFMPWEKTVLFAGYILPAVSRAIASDLGLPLAPFVIGAVYLFVLRRGLYVGADVESADMGPRSLPAFDCARDAAALTGRQRSPARTLPTIQGTPESKHS